LSAVLFSACQYSDIVAFRNDTEATLTLHAEVDDEFLYYDCDGSGSDLTRFQDEATFEVPPGISMCLEGPINDPKDTYVVQDLIELVEISRDGAICVSMDGSAIGEQVVTDGFHKTVVIDDESCP